MWKAHTLFIYHLYYFANHLSLNVQWCVSDIYFGTIIRLLGYIKLFRFSLTVMYLFRLPNIHPTKFILNVTDLLLLTLTYILVLHLIENFTSKKRNITVKLSFEEIIITFGSIIRYSSIISFSRSACLIFRDYRTHWQIFFHHLCVSLSNHIYNHIYSPFYTFVAPIRY